MADAMAEWFRAQCRDVLGVPSASDQEAFSTLAATRSPPCSWPPGSAPRFSVGPEPAEILLAGSLGELIARLRAVAADDTVSHDPTCVRYYE
jgi:hypothetical protein